MLTPGGTSPVGARQLADHAATQHYRDIFEYAPLGIFQSTPDGRILIANPAFFRMLGYDSLEDVRRLDLGRDVYLDPDERSRLVAQHLESRKPWTVEIRWKRRDGTPVWVRLTAHAVRDDAGRVCHFESFVQDITQARLADEQTREALAWQRAVVDGSRDAIFVSDAEARFTMVNQAACDLTGYSQDELLRMRIPDLHEEPDLAAFRAYHARIMAGTETLSEAKIRRRDGSKVDTEFNNRRVVVGGQTYMHTVARDISERKRALSLLAATLESTADGILVVDLEGSMVRCNRKLLDMWRMPEDVAAHRNTRVAHVLDQVQEPEAFAARMGALYASPEEESFDVIELKDGRIFERCSQPHRVGDQCVGRVVSFRDVTAQRRGEQMKTRLLHHLISAQENERRRLARELHDETSQSLTSLLVGLRSIEEMARLPQVRSTAHILRGIAGETLENVGRLAQGLHPSLLDDLGLIPALTRSARDHSTLYGLAIEIEASGLGDERLPLPVETTLYRVAQEAITNVARHAGARRVGLSLSRLPGLVRLVVQDDGAGFDLTAERSAHDAGHLGLYGIRERVALLGGQAIFRSAPGQGTTLTVEIPLES